MTIPSLLDPDDRKILRSKSLDYFKERYSYKDFNLSLDKNTLTIHITKQQDLPQLIKSCPLIADKAILSIGASSVAINLNKKTVFTYRRTNFTSSTGALQFKQTIKQGLESMSQAIAISPQEQKEENLPAITPQDELVSMAEITARTEIPEENFAEFVSLGGIKAYKLRGEMLLPRGAVRTAIQSFYAWEADQKANNALNLLAKQEVQFADETEPQNNGTLQATVQATDGTKKPRKSNSSPRAKYKLPADFKPSNAYAKALNAIIEAQGKKSSDFLNDVAGRTEDGLAIIKKAAAKYKNTEKAENGLLKAALELSSQSQNSNQ
jgi:hypothetical protein